MTRQQFLFPEFEETIVEKPVNVASVPQRSPFRYPGGKTWFVPRFRQWMKSFDTRPRVLVELFTGGGIVGLTAAFENLADKIYMVELDEQVAAVWKTIFSPNVHWLVKNIRTFDMNAEALQLVLNQKNKSLREIAFQTILKNRTAHGGILAGGAGIIKNGENGKGIHSRWYPETIAKRILAIHSVAEKIVFIQGDAFDVMGEYKKNKDAVFFIDPPYTAGGKKAGSRLYNHFSIDHEHLFSSCKMLKGHFLMTYDNAEEVKVLADKNGFETKAIPMKNTHHAKLDELIISKNLSWAK